MGAGKPLTQWTKYPTLRLRVVDLKAKELEQSKVSNKSAFEEFKDSTARKTHNEVVEFFKSNPNVTSEEVFKELFKSDSDVIGFAKMMNSDVTKPVSFLRRSLSRIPIKKLVYLVKKYYENVKD